MSPEPRRLLIVEDDRPMRRLLATLGRSQGFLVMEAATSALALASATKTPPDLVLLDLGLPDADGITLTKTIRTWSSVPIIVISARHGDRDKVMALDAGADDYLTKPFSAEELLARIRAAMRRSVAGAQRDDGAVIRCGPLELDLAYRKVTLAGREIHLTPIEYKLLVCLARRPGRVLTHDQILAEIWGDTPTALAHHVRVHMAQLRRKLEDDPAQPRFILTEVGVGYRFAETDDPRAD